MIKNLPAMQETWVRSLGWEDPLEKGVAAHSNILAWRIPWTEEPGGLQSMGSQELDTTEQLTQEKFHLSLSHKSNCFPYFHFFSQPDFQFLFTLYSSYSILNAICYAFRRILIFLIGIIQQD